MRTRSSKGNDSKWAIQVNNSSVLGGEIKKNNGWEPANKCIEESRCKQNIHTNLKNWGVWGRSAIGALMRKKSSQTARVGPGRGLLGDPLTGSEAGGRVGLLLEFLSAKMSKEN